MNIAFEISPLLLASGTFGDKSGVYRYYLGLIKSYGEYIKKQNNNSKIILFSFDRDLLDVPKNREALNLLENDVFIFLNKFKRSEKNLIRNFEFLGFLLKPLRILNKILPIKLFYFYIINEIRFHRYLKLLDKELKKHKISIIYHSDTSFFPLKGYKNIITIYDLTPIILSQFHRNETKDLTERKLYFANKHCHGIVCISNSTQRDLLANYPNCSKKKLLVCYPGLDPVFKEPIDDSLFEDLKLVIANQTTYLKKKKYLLYYGTFEPRKNLINLVQSFVEMQQEKKISKDFKLILLGGDGWGKIKKTVSNFAKENFPVKEKNNVIVLDYLNDSYLKSLIKNAYGVVYPSIYEGFGLPVLESMAMGTPVICSIGSSFKEVGQSAVLYSDPHNYNDLKDKMIKLIKNPKLAKRLSKEGIEQSKKFSWNKNAKKLHDFFKSF